MKRNNQNEATPSTTTRARSTDASRMSPMPAGVADQLGPAGLERDDEAFERSISTTLPEIEAGIRRELDESASIVTVIGLAGSAGLGPEPIDLRISCSSEIVLQQLVWASYWLFGDGLMSGQVLAEEPNPDAPLQVELLRNGQTPGRIYRKDGDETPSRLFLQVSDKRPSPEPWLYDLHLGLSKEQAVNLQRWRLNKEARLAKEGGLLDEMPRNLVKGFINMGLTRPCPTLGEAIDGLCTEISNEFGMRDHIRRFTIGAFYMTGRDNRERFLAGDKSTCRDLAHLMCRVHAPTE